MKAADQGMADAEFVMGQLFQQGRGLTQDEQMAREWYQKAADQGHEEAAEALAALNQ